MNPSNLINQVEDPLEIMITSSLKENCHHKLEVQNHLKAVKEVENELLNNDLLSLILSNYQ